MYRTTTWKSCNDTTILYTTLHSRYKGRHAPHYGALLLHAPPELGKGYIHLTVANGAVNHQSPPHRSRCHLHRLHSRDQVTSGYTTKLRLLRHDTASKAVLAILRRKFKPTPRSTTRSRLQPTARNNVVGTIPHTARSTLRDSSRSHCCKHLSLHCLRLSDLRHGPQRKEGASQEERHRQCSCRKGHRTIK